MLKKSDLHNYQVHNIQHIIDNRYAGLFLDMGAGKTVITLSAIDYLMYSDLDVSRVLVVAPKRVAENVWSDELKVWEHLTHLSISIVSGTPAERIAALNVPADIYTISRDNFAWLCKRLEKVNKLPFDMIVLDESSSFKDRNTNRWKAAKSLRPKLRRVVALTGTPAPNTLMDLWAQIYILDRGKRLGRNITRYRNAYFIKDEYRPYTYHLREGADKIIFDKIGDICISMTNADLNIELPELVINRVNLTFDERLQKQYKDFEKEKVMELISEVMPDALDNTGEVDPTQTDAFTPVITAVNAAVLFTKLSQFANGTIYDDEGGINEIHDLKLDALEELVEEAQGSPMLVAYNYRHDRDRIMKRLKKYRPRLLTNSQDLRDWNAGKIRVLVVHPASMGHGLNMQHGGSYITWYGLTPSLERYMQLNARLYRQGKKERVVVNIISIRNTNDDRLYSIIVEKDKTQASLMEALRVKIREVLNYGKEL